MKHAAQQSSTRTLTDLLRAADRRQPVTVTALTQERDETGRTTGRLIETVRTIEIHAYRTTRAGHICITGMDREAREYREIRLDWLISYTVHRSTYVIDTPEPASDPEPAPTTVAQFVARELARDIDDADYIARTAA